MSVRSLGCGCRGGRGAAGGPKRGGAQRRFKCARASGPASDARARANTRPRPQKGKRAQPPHTPPLLPPTPAPRGSCGYFGNVPEYVAAWPDVQDGGVPCGRCFAVRCRPTTVRNADGEQLARACMGGYMRPAHAPCMHACAACGMYACMHCMRRACCVHAPPPPTPMRRQQPMTPCAPQFLSPGPWARIELPREAACRTDVEVVVKITGVAQRGGACMLEMQTHACRRMHADACMHLQLAACMLKTPSPSPNPALTDTCPCNGNEQWCCGNPGAHLDLSNHAFGAIVQGGDIGVGIIGIDFRWAAADRMHAWHAHGPQTWYRCRRRLRPVQAPPQAAAAAGAAPGTNVASGAAGARAGPPVGRGFDRRNFERRRDGPSSWL